MGADLSRPSARTASGVSRISAGTAASIFTPLLWHITCIPHRRPSKPRQPNDRSSHGRTPFLAPLTALLPGDPAVCAVNPAFSENEFAAEATPVIEWPMETVKKIRQQKT